MERNFKSIINNSNTIAVSVVMPVFNVQEFLSEAIQSVLNQSFINIELILVNDGSSDDSLNICNHFKELDSRIKVINQKNSGVSVARNSGLNLATGEYLYFMDSDDTIDEKFIETSYKNAIVNSSEFIVIGSYFKQRLPNPTAFPTCAMMLKKSFLDKYPEVRFPKNIQPCEDGLFSHQLLALNPKLSINELGIYNYRKHDNQNTKMINKNSSKTLEQIPIWFKVLEEFYTKYDLFESHSLHLAKFIEHEPFEFRFLSMNLTEIQKNNLCQKIKLFYNKNVEPNLLKKDQKKLSKIFIYFINSNNIQEFRNNSKNYFNKLSLMLKLVKCIPIKKVKRKYTVTLENKLQFKDLIQ